MPTLQIGPGASSLGNGDRKAGVQCNFNASNTAVGYDPDKYTYSLPSMMLTISSCKYYSVYGYFDVYNQAGTLIGRTKQWNVAENAGSVKASGASAISCTFTLINTNLVAAMQTSSFYIIIRRSGGSGNCCNIRNGCTGTLKINYTKTTKNTAPNAPNLVFPQNWISRDPQTYNKNPWVRVQLMADPEGNQMQVGYTLTDHTAGDAQIVSLTWRDTWHSVNEIEQWQLPTLTTGHSYYMYAYARDKNLAVSAATGPRWFYVAPNNWTTSTVIDDTAIDELQNKINIVRNSWYGMDNYNFTTCDNGTRLNRSQIVELENAIEATPNVATTAYTSPTVGTKAILSQLSNINALLERA